MLPRGVVSSVLFFFFLCALLMGGAPVEAGVLPGPVAPRPFPGPAAVPLVPRGPDYSGGCLRIYANETTSTHFYVAPGPGVELADDLHTTATGMQVLCAFDFGYFKPDPGVVDATVMFYDNTIADVGPGDLLAGPFLVAGLPTGANAFHVEVPGGFVDGDVWMSVAFSDGQTGLLTFDPPDQGTSHDLAWVSSPPGIGNLGGTPPANFFLGVYTSSVTPARTSTWGGIKLIYR
jgi:hypothetical protein